MLLAPCADLIARSRHVIVIPDGILNLLPFSYLINVDMMRSAGGETGGGVEGLSCTMRTVSRAPAATVLAWLRESRGGVVESHRSGNRVLAVAGRFSDRGESLRGARREVDLLARRYSGVVTSFLNPDILKEFDILHFAAHSTADDQSPWRSAIHLDTEDDRTALRASRIAEYKLPAGLVVLSSCESAGGRILSGEGVQGLASAFLSAGVPSVVATLWPVDDRATVEFMNAFYEALQGGESVAASLACARSAVRGRSCTSHPFYWAGFVAIGEGALHVGLRAKPLRRLLPWAVLILIPTVIWLVLSIGREKKYGAQ
jgi:hypothetical protein